MPDPNDSLIDGVDILGGRAEIHSGGRNEKAPEENWTGSLRGVVLVGQNSVIENDNSWKHTPAYDQDGNHAEYLYQQGVGVVGMGSKVSVINEGTLICGSRCDLELQNDGITLIGGGLRTELGYEDTSYTAITNSGIILGGFGSNLIDNGDYGNCSYLFFPNKNDTKCLISGNVRLDKNCNIWDTDNRQIVKNGKLVVTS